MAILKFCNQGGFPCIEALRVSTSGTVTTVTFNNHPYRMTNRFYGGFFIKLPLITETDTNSLQFDTEGLGGSSLPVYNNQGVAATVADIANDGPTIKMCFYDRDSNKVQLID